MILVIVDELSTINFIWVKSGRNVMQIGRSVVCYKEVVGFKWIIVSNAKEGIGWCVIGNKVKLLL